MPANVAVSSFHAVAAFVRRSRLLVAVWICLLSCVGCGGPGYEAVDLTGTVTIDDKPVPKGQVTFQPLGGGPVVGGEIVDGKYTCQAVAVGKCRVTFVAQAAEMKTIEIPATGGTGQVPINILPDKYSAGIEETIAADQTTQDFSLTSE